MSEYVESKYLKMTDEELKNLPEEEKADALLDLINSMGPLIEEICQEAEENLKRNQITQEELDECEVLNLVVPCNLNKSSDTSFTTKPASKSECNRYEIQTADLVTLVEEHQDDLSQYLDEDIKNIKFIREVLISRRNRYHILYEIYYQGEFDKERIIEFIKGQSSDGWGERLEQDWFKTIQTERSQFSFSIACCTDKVVEL